MFKIYGFTTESEKHKKYGRTVEDSYAFDEKRKVVAVADGVTRDPSEVLPDLNTEAGKLEFSRNYPRPSPAKTAADIFTSNFVRLVNPSEQGIKKAFEKANQVIKRWNNMHMKNPDYLTKDFAGCVAAGAVVSKDHYFYGFICDCGLVVFDKNGKIKMITDDEGPGKHDHAISKTMQERKLTWNMPEGRVLVRKEFRNKPQERYTFGVLTGEDAALSYIRIGSGKLNQGDIVMVYSDDARPIITSKEFSQKIKAKDFSGIEELMQESVNNEGTLAYYVHE